MYRVLLIAGEADYLRALLAGYEVVSVSNDLELLYRLAQGANFDLILGDIGSPEVLMNVRLAYPAIPVLVLARQPSLEAAFQSGQIGAAGYLPALVDADTLHTQVESAIRQAVTIPLKTSDTNGRPSNTQHAADEDEPSLMHVRELTIDRRRRVAMFRAQRLNLTRSQFDILAKLVENKGRVVLFEELVYMLQGHYPHRSEARRALSAHMSNLRDALKKQGCEGYIVNSRGRGFVIESDVEEKLRQSEARLQFLLQQIPACIWSLDTDLQLTWAGGAELADFNMKPEDVIGMSAVDLLRNERGEDSVDIVASRQALQGEPVRYERRVLDRIYEVRVEPLYDTDGSILGTIALALNITERKHAEERLRESEERYRIISGMMSDYVYASRLKPGDEYNTELEWVAGALTGITGYTEEEAKGGMGWDRLVHPDDWHIVERRRKALLDGRQDTSEFRMTGKHGKSYWVRTYTYPLWDDQEDRVVSIYAAVKDITEQKEAQEALRRSEEVYRIISEMMGVAVYVFRIVSDHETVVEWTTGAYEQLMGRPVEEAKHGVDFTPFTHPDDLPILQQRMQRLCAGEPDISEVRILNDGEVRWLRVYGYPVWNEAHTEVVKVYGGVRDITERKQADEALRESEANIRRIVEEAPTPMLLFQETKVVFVNQAVETISGYSREEWLTMDFYEVIHPDMQEAAIERALRRQRGEKVRSRYELKIITKAGEERWIDYMATLIQFQGQPAVLAIVADITQRKTMEESLRQTEADLRGLIASTPAPMLLFQGATLLYVNRAAEDLTGYSLDELRGMAFWDVIHPDMREQVRERGLKRQEGKPVPQRYEVKMLTKGGETRWVDYMGTLIQYEGKPAVLGIVFDITDRKRMEAALLEIEERLRMVLEYMPVMVDAFDEQGSIVFWNQECELITGYTMQEIAGHPNAMQMLYPNPNYLNKHLAEWERRGDNFRDWEWDITTKDGSARTIAWSNISAQFPIAGWKTWGIGVDVTARKAMERALHETEERLRMVMASAPVVLWAINKDGIYTLSEGKALEALGYQPGEAVGQSIFEINSHLPHILDNVKRALAGVSFTAQDEPNRGLVFETLYIPVCDDEGQVTDVLGVSVNVTGPSNSH